MEENRSWCPIPWKGLSVRNNGDFRVCCHANTSATQGLIKNSSGETQRAETANFSGVRNGELLKEIRAAMLRGERHSTCTRCNQEDDSGVRSRRVYEKDFWRGHYELTQAKAETQPSGEIHSEKVPIEFYDLRFGNLCNLKCRMCGPTDSSLWYKEHFETNEKSFKDTTGKIILENQNGKIAVQGGDPYSWHESPEFWAQIESNLSHVRRIHTVGGEPFLIERHYDLLKKIIDSGRADQVIMDYTSNIVKIPERAFELWKHFKEVRIGCSLDGYGKINEYIRHPSKWSVIEKNLELLDSAPGNFNLWITSTVMAYNIYYLTDFIRWKLEKNFKRTNLHTSSMPFLTTHPLHTAKHFNVKILPPVVKQMVEEKFRAFRAGWFQSYLESANYNSKEKEHLRAKMDSLLNGYIDFMKQEDWSELLPKFWQSTQKMDLYRGENFAEVMPEIAEPIREFLMRGKNMSGQEVASFV